MQVNRATSQAGAARLRPETMRESVGFFGHELSVDSDRAWLSLVVTRDLSSIDIDEDGDPIGWIEVTDGVLDPEASGDADPELVALVRHALAISSKPEIRNLAGALKRSVAEVEARRGGASMSGPHPDGSTFDAQDGERLGTLQQRVYRLMRDGRWRTLRVIANEAGGTEAIVSARLRDFRKDKFRESFPDVADVDRRRVDGGLHEYRLRIVDPADALEAQGSLFGEDAR